MKTNDGGAVCYFNQRYYANELGVDVHQNYNLINKVCSCEMFGDNAIDLFRSGRLDRRSLL